MVVFTIVIVFGINCLNNKANYSTWQFVGTTVCEVAIIYFYYRNTNSSLIKLTIAPKGLIIDYIITQKQIIIDYADIVHINNVNVGGNSDSILPTLTYLKLEIELSTGEELDFTENQFSNYAELKEAIRRQRFHLN